MVRHIDCYVFLRWIIAIWTVIFALVLGGALKAAESRPHVAVIGESSLRDSSALLVTALTEGDAVTLVEREELARVFDEWKVNAQGLSTADAVKIGRLLRADGFLLVQKPAGLPTGSVSLRLVAVRPGIVVSHDIYSEGVFTPEGIRTIIAPQLTTRWPKLLIQADEAIPLSFAGLHSTVSGATLRKWEHEMNWLLGHRLILHPKIFLLERQNMRWLWEENERNEFETIFLTGQAVLEGRLEQRDGKLHIKALLKKPDGTRDVTLRIDGSPENLPDIADRLARKVFETLDAGSMTGSWSADEESKFYHEMAVWAMDHYLLPEAQEAAESAWALGGRGDALNELRMRAYGAAAYPYWGNFRKGGARNDYSFYAVDVRKEPERLDAAIRAVEILVDHLQSHPRTEQEYSAFHDRGEVNYDYRILSTRVLLNSARLLRCFYEDDATVGHRERLDYLRKLIRTALDTLIRNERELDERLLWVYRIQSAYAPYIYEQPEEVVAVYRNLFERNIKAWIFDRDGMTSGWSPPKKGPPDESVVNRIAKNMYVPFVLGWNHEEEERAQAVWSEFLHNLRTSEKPDEQAAYWAFTTRDKIPPEVAAPLREFMWQNRAQLLDNRKQNFVWEQLGKKYFHANPTQEECIRLYTYLMQEGTHVNTLMVSSILMRIDFSKTDPAELEDLLNQYLKRAEEYLSGDDARDHLIRARQSIGNQFTESYIAWKKNGGSQPEKPAGPFKFVELVEGALPVTRFWSSWTHLEGKDIGWSLDHFHYADGKIWCYRSPDIVSIDLATFKTETVTSPPVRYIQSLTAGGGHLFVATDDSFGATQESVLSYNLKTGKWKPIDVPKSPYRLQFIGDYCYLLFGRGNFENSFNTWDSNETSGIYRYDPSNGQLKLLTSTRRRPAQCELDPVPRYKPLRLTRAHDGSLYLHIETDYHGHHQSFYKSNPEGDDWKLSFSLHKDSPPVIRNDPGGLLCGLHCYIGIPSYQYFPDVGGHNHMHTIRIGDHPGKDNSNDGLGSLPPLAVLNEPGQRGIRSAEKAFDHFWMLSIRNPKSRPIFHRYNERDDELIDIPLDFRISKAEQLRIREIAGNSADVAQVATRRADDAISWLRHITQVVPVADGFVFVSEREHGFWHLPLSEIESYISESQGKAGSN